MRKHVSLKLTNLRRDRIDALDATRNAFGEDVLEMSLCQSSHFKLIGFRENLEDGYEPVYHLRLGTSNDHAARSSSTRHLWKSRNAKTGLLTGIAMCSMD